MLCCALLWHAATGIAQDGKSGLATNVVKLPQGPGSLEGVGENAEPNLSMGLVSYGIDVAVPPGHHGLSPQLRLQYTSHEGSSTLGLGWALSIPSIERMTARGLPDYDRDDLFAADGGQELVRVPDSDVYRARFEGAFVRYHWHAAEDGAHGYWEAEYPDGRRGYFGATADGRTVDEARIESDAGTFSYMLVEVLDPFGHAIRYSYDKPPEDGYPYLKEIAYAFGTEGPRYQIELAYEPREDILSDGKPGREVRVGQRLRDIRVRVHGQLLRRTHLAYESPADSGGLSRLASVTTFGTGDATSYPVRFRFSYTGVFDPSCERVDCLRPQVRSLGALPLDLRTGDADLFDVNRDHLPDVIDTREGAHVVYLQDPEKEGTAFGEGVRSKVSGTSAMRLRSASVRAVDLDGDGSADLVDSLNNEVLFAGGRRDWSERRALATLLPSFADDAGLRFLDVDYDRRIDCLHLDPGSGWYFRNLGNNRYATTPTAVDAPGVDFADPAVQTADMNGDGMLDVVRVLSGGLAVYHMNLGHGHFSAAIEMHGLPEKLAPEGARLVDLNGDSLADVVVVSGAEVAYALNRSGRGFSALSSVDDADGEIPEYTPETTLRFADMNGSGSTDVLWFGPGGEVQYLELFPRRANLLSRIDNGIGKVIELGYGTSVEHMARDAADRPWTEALPHVMITLDRVATYDTLSGVQQVQTFHYRDGYFDGEEHQFRGFREVEVRTSGDASVEEGFRVRRFEVGDEDRYRKGLLKETESRSAGRSIRASLHEYEDCSVAEVPDDTALPVRFLCRVGTTEVSREGLAETEWATTREELDYDGYGNPTAVRKLGVVPAEGAEGCAPCRDDPMELHGEACGPQCLGDEVYEERAFVVPGDDTAGRWILHAPLRERRYGVPGSDVYWEQLNYYDGEAFTGLPLGQLSAGLVSRQTQKRDAGGAAVVTAARTAYDEHANPVAMLDANGHRREVAYDDGGLLPVYEDLIFDDPGHAPYALRLQLGYHELQEKPVWSSTWMRVEDGSVVSEERRTQYAYDEFGRLERLAKPGDDLETPTQVFAYELADPVSRIVARTRSEAGGELDLEGATCFDGMGRKVQDIQRVEAGLYQASGYAEFNAQGQQSRSRQPYQVSSTACASEPPAGILATRSFYDAEGRLAGQELPDDGIYGEASQTITVYEPLRTVVYDAEDDDPGGDHHETPTTSRLDGQGRIVAIERQLAGRGAAILTRFSYDTLGYLSELIDDAGNRKQQKHDLLGRPVEVIDPDAGRTTYVHDDVGNVLEATDARGVTVITSYDEANRPTARFEQGSRTDTEIGWVYDQYPACPAEDCSYPEGQLVATRYPLPGGSLGEDRFGYDERARQRFFQRSLDSCTFRFAFAFDNADRPTETQYPNKMRVRRTLDGMGRLTSIPGYVNEVKYTEAGLPDVTILANGTRTDHDYDDVLRLAQLKTTGDNGAALLGGYAYSHDRVGNVTHIQDLRDGDADRASATGDYVYDALYRLRAAYLGPGHEAAELMSYEYDTVDNLTLKKSDRGDLSAAHVGAYAYGERGAGPHAVSTAGERQYGYDLAGNVVARGDQSLSWDFLGRLRQASQGPRRLERYGYGIDRQRVTKNEGPLTTWYVAPDFEVRDGVATVYLEAPSVRIKVEDAGHGASMLGDGVRGGPRDGPVTAADALLADSAGEPEAARSLLAASARRMLVGEGEEVTYIHQDHLGSAALTTNSDGTALQRTYHYPYGEIRTQQGYLEDYSFTGQERDQRIGLSYHSARYLDTWTGRWVSPDPWSEQVPTDDASRRRRSGRYAYVMDNPLLATDATGKKGRSTDLERSVRFWTRAAERKWVGRENLLDELGLIGQVADILSRLPYKRPGRLSEEGKYVNGSTQCVSFVRMALSIFVDESLQPRKTGTETPGALFGTLVGENFTKAELETLNPDKLYALQSMDLEGNPKHASMLTYSDWLGSWITIESTFRKKGRLLSKTTGANIYRLSDVPASERTYNVYEVGPKYKAPDPKLEDWDFE